MKNLRKLNLTVAEAVQCIASKCQNERSPIAYASAVLNSLLRCGIVTLQVDGKRVDPSWIAVNLTVVSDGLRTRCALEKPMDQYVWTISAAEIRNILANFDRTLATLFSF